MRGIWLAIAFLAGCSSAPERPEPVDLADASDSAQVSLDWSANLGEASNSAVSLSPLVLENSLWAAAGTRLTQVDLDSGRVLSEIDLTASVTTGLAGLEGRLYFGNEAGELVAVDTDAGTVAWSFPLNAELLTAPTLGQDQVLILSTDGVLTAVSDRGTQLWRKTADPAQLTYRGQARPVALRGGYLVAKDNGDLMAVLEEDGLDVWRRRFGSRTGDLVDLDATPLVLDNLAVIAGGQTGAQGIDLNGGSSVWRSDVRSLRRITTDGQAAFVVAVDGELYALDLQTGAVLWRQPEMAFRYPHEADLLGEFVAVVDAQGLAHAFERQTGSPVSRLKTPLQGAVSLTRAGQSLILQDTQGRLARISVNP